MKAEQDKASARIKRITLLDPKDYHRWEEAGLRAKLRAYVIADQFITFCERLIQKKTVPRGLEELFESVPQDRLLAAYKSASLISYQPDGSHEKMATLEISFIGGNYNGCCMEFHIKEWGHVEQVAGTFHC